jgi:Holliday junction DNA helicase RuvA
MIEYVSGKLDSVTPATATVECHGVGYLLNISLNTFSAIQGKSEVRLYVYEAIREDAWVLFGFATLQERQLFLQLISVSGVGGNTARTILSAFTPAELCNVILNGDEKMLKTVKGLGAKTSQRIIVEIKDKVASLGIMPEVALKGEETTASFNKQVYDDATEALKALGYSPAPVAKAVKAILKDEPDASVEKVIKRAFKML